jgi:DNA-binding XRE family transcriptional regulator
MPRGKKNQPAGVGMTLCITTLGQMIRDRRLELDLRQVEVAQLIDIPRSNYRLIENGARLPSRRIARKLADVFGWEPEIIFAHLTETELSEIIDTRCKKLEISTQQLAELAGVCAETIHIIMRSGYVDFKFARTLAKALQLKDTTILKFAKNKRIKRKIESQFGRCIQAQRIELGITCAEMARELNITTQAYCMIEHGIIKLTNTRGRVIEIARILSLDHEKLAALLTPRRAAKRLVNRARSEPEVQTLGTFLLARRLELQMSQSKVAEKACIAVGTYCHLELHPLKRTPYRSTIRLIELALDCTIPPELLTIALPKTE